MHDVLRQRVIRHLESLPEEQIYQVLDYIEFLESKYARNLQVEASALQRFAEGLEDKLRKKAMSPHTLREAFQLIAAADRVLSSVSNAGREILGELSARPDAPDESRRPAVRPPSSARPQPSRPTPPAGGEPGGDRGSGTAGGSGQGPI
jgi:hypothetical protein